MKKQFYVLGARQQPADGLVSHIYSCRGPYIIKRGFVPLYIPKKQTIIVKCYLQGADKGLLDLEFGMDAVEGIVEFMDACTNTYVEGPTWLNGHYRLNEPARAIDLIKQSLETDDE